MLRLTPTGSGRPRFSELFDGFRVGLSKDRRDRFSKIARSTRRMIFMLRVRGKSLTSRIFSGRYDAPMPRTSAEDNSSARPFPVDPHRASAHRRRRSPGAHRMRNAEYGGFRNFSVAIRMPSSSAGPVRLPEILMVSSGAAESIIEAIVPAHGRIAMRTRLKIVVQ